MISSEKIDGVIGASLPGGVQIHYGPEPANADSNTGSNNGPVASVGSGPSVESLAVEAASTTSSTLSSVVQQEEPTSTLNANALTEPSPALSADEINALAKPSPTPSTSEINALAEPSPAPTSTLSDPPIPEGYELVRTDYVTNGNTVSKIVVVETVEYVMVATETVTVTATLGAQKARRQLQHLHRHAHH
jgi:hypothetical protein